MDNIASPIPENLDTSPIPLTETHTEILTLLTSIEETRLSLALLDAHANPTFSTDDIANLTPSALPAELQEAERQLLEARAHYTLRNRIVNQALIADPILNAVHAAPPDASQLQHSLLPAIHARDVLAMLHGEMTTRVASAEQRAMAAESEVKEVNARNAELAKRVLALAEEVREDRTDDVQDAEVRMELEQLDREIVEKRREWRAMKSLVAGIVVGSGVNWGKDEKLVELVLDDEDELQ